MTGHSEQNQKEYFDVTASAAAHGLTLGTCLKEALDELRSSAVYGVNKIEATVRADATDAREDVRDSRGSNTNGNSDDNDDDNNANNANDDENDNANGGPQDNPDDIPEDSPHDEQNRKRKAADQPQAPDQLQEQQEQEEPDQEEQHPSQPRRIIMDKDAQRRIVMSFGHAVAESSAIFAKRHAMRGSHDSNSNSNDDDDDDGSGEEGDAYQISPPSAMLYARLDHFNRVGSDWRVVVDSVRIGPPKRPKRWPSGAKMRMPTIEPKPIAISQNERDKMQILAFNDEEWRRKSGRKGG